MSCLRYVVLAVALCLAVLPQGCGGTAQEGPPPKEYAKDIARGNVKPETGNAAITIEFSNSFDDSPLARMKVFLLVRDPEGNALFNDETVTDERGVAKFKGLPAQEVAVRVWNPDKGACEFKVDLAKYTGKRAGAVAHSCLF